MQLDPTSSDTLAPRRRAAKQEIVVSPGWWWNLPIILMVGILVPLGVRSQLTHDSRYGWGTFGRQTIYQMKYQWEFEDGRREIYWPGDELRQEARKHVGSSRQLNTRYGLGAILVWIQGYGRYMWEHRPEGVRAFHVVLRYELDKTRRLRLSKSASELRFHYPTEAGR